MSNSERLKIVERIMEQARKNPELMDKLEREAKKAKYYPYLTAAHKKNSEAAMKQQEEWAKSPASLEEDLRRQREREK